MNYQIELFHSLLHDFLEAESALLTTDGQVLAVKGEKPSSFGPLTAAANTVLKYLPLQEGDIAILNDPYSGGTHLNNITFVMAVSEDLIWVLSKERALDIRICKSVEEEGLRIPPTPILQKNKFNDMILTAMSAHPECSADFIEWIKYTCTQIAGKGHKLFSSLENTGFTITSELISEYLELCKESALHAISERAYGDIRIDVNLDSGELLRMSIEASKTGIKLDFGGSSISKGLALTESATYGACFLAVAKHYGFDKLANSGTFGVIQISKPAGCWMIAKYPQSTLRGMLCGIPAIHTAIELAFASLHKKTEQSYSAHCPVYIQLKQDGIKRSFTLESGAGATNTGAGESAVFEGALAELEAVLPVQITNIGPRPRTTPQYKNQGGLGVEMQLLALAEIEVTWMTDLTRFRPREGKNLHNGDGSEVLYNNEPQSFSGTRKLFKGESIMFRSANGGDFGKEIQKEPQ